MSRFLPSRLISRILFWFLGHRPHVVYTRLDRNKIDCNREINQATLNVPDAIQVYQDYTGFIGKAKSAISGRGLLLDVHGYERHKLERIQLGYLINRSNLEQENYRIEDATSRNLGKFWCGSDNSCFRDFIHGSRSLGDLFSQEGLQAVPSVRERTPKGDHYRHGGYIIETYGSRDGGEIDAIQIEFPKKLRFGWDDDLQRRVVRAMSRFFELNYVLHL